MRRMWSASAWSKMRPGEAACWDMRRDDGGKQHQSAGKYFDDALNGADDHIAYLATKAGLENLTRSFAMRLAPSIKVNSIAPALIMFNDGDSEEQQAKLLARSALGLEPGPEVVYQAGRLQELSATRLLN